MALNRMGGEFITPCSDGFIVDVIVCRKFISISEATSGDYDHLLFVSMEYVDVE